MKQPTIFFGSSIYTLPIIAFLQKQYDLKLVLTTEQKLTDAVPKYCKEHDILYESVTSLKENTIIIQKLQIIHAEFAILAYFGAIIPQSIITLFPKGIINIHPSRLPQYRGTTPGQTAILLGDIRTAVSIMLLDKEIDHGPLLGQEVENILPTDTAPRLYKRLFDKGVTLLAKILPIYLSGELLPKAQDHNKATYTKVLTRESGFLNDKLPVAPGLLERMVRAYDPWPGVWTRVTRLKDTVLTGKIVKFLPNDMIQVEGKKPVSYRDFRNGYKHADLWLSKFLT